ncbi:hypothetical protein I3843_09G098700 [Carya illinoinensis]|uniref:Uncharacterized protein n=1 Tax=Carya illinoinensis TaxID=32201 RepID=A0A922J825_CARIL|nr:hypothetical protein I3842_09G098000 [Carya illinoinensis]KAG7963060.1 hypothetical protein I3843_09G098700 [Carya illinoinensis]
MEDEREIIYSRSPQVSGYLDKEGVVELRSFRLCLKWVCLDQSNIWRSGLSWSIFFLLSFGVPLLSNFALSCSSCDDDHTRPYHSVVQISLSIFATLSFVCLTRWARKFGLRRFLFLDKLSDASDKVQHGYAEQIQRSMKLLLIFILPCFGAVSAYKVWWYVSGATELPYYGNIYLSDTILCTLELCSWLYRTSIFFLVCFLFRLICYLQILRLEDFAQTFQKETEVGSILLEHLRIRRNLRIISHRFRAFILSCLVLVTASQLISLLMTIRSSAKVNIFKAGELTICSISLVTGLFICLRSATKITHRAHSITSLAAKWHACATINSFDNTDGETPRGQITSAQVFHMSAVWESDDEEGDGDDDLDNTKLVPIFAHTISFQKRQALVTYLENNKAGITVFGFMLDRTWLHSIFVIQLALLLWLLNKTVGIS